MFAMKVVLMEQKMVQREPKMLSFMAHYGHWGIELPVWPNVELHGLIWHCRILCGIYNPVTLFRLIGHRSKFIWSCLQT